jgi:tetratricopeptide (TPR) repeat protein
MNISTLRSTLRSTAASVRKSAAQSLVAAFAFSGLLLGQAAAPIATPAPAADATPAEISIRKAQEQIRQKPQHVPYYNALAMAYARRARESSDVTFYAKAEETLQKSFELAPDPKSSGNYEARKVQVWLQLGRHEFSKALETAMPLNKLNPDDVTVYGYIADANTELGRYDAAVDAIQWMLKLKPGNIAGLTRAAYQRELRGDLSGALELMQMAYDATPFQEREDRAWILTQMAHLHTLASESRDGLSGDNLKQAEQFATGALGLFPNYHYAQAALAQIRIIQKRYPEAVALLQARYQSAPHAENLFALAEALKLDGQTEKAEHAFAEFEKASLAESNIADNSNHELMAYYLDHARQSERALKLAEQELARRQDVFTLDLHAWALARTGRIAEARAEIQKVVALGVKDPRILRHAAAIADQAHADQAHADQAHAVQARAARVVRKPAGTPSSNQARSPHASRAS